MVMFIFISPLFDTFLVDKIYDWEINIRGFEIIGVNIQ